MPASGIQTHIDDVSRSLEEWLRDALPDVDLAFVLHFPAADAEGGPGPTEGQPRVEICFHSIAEEKPDRALLNRDEAFLLTYALRITGADALTSQRIYSRIYFATRESADFGIGSPPAVAGRGVEEPPSLFVTARLVRRAAAAAPGVVMHPLDLRLRSLGRIAGKVVTEEGTPVMRADIEARGLNKRVASDAAGRFTIPGAPATGTVSLRVTVRDRHVDVLVDIEKQAEVVIVMPEENEHA